MRTWAYLKEVIASMCVGVLATAWIINGSMGICV